MLVSAITMHNNGYHMSNALPYSTMKSNYTIGDTSFNSLTPYGRKSVAQDKLSMLFDSINEWKNYCHKQILGEKLNIIA